MCWNWEIWELTNRWRCHGGDRVTVSTLAEGATGGLVVLYLPKRHCGGACSDVSTQTPLWGGLQWCIYPNATVGGPAVMYLPKRHCGGACSDVSTQTPLWGGLQWCIYPVGTLGITFICITLMCVSPRSQFVESFTTRLALVFARLWLWILKVFHSMFVISFMIHCYNDNDTWFICITQVSVSIWSQFVESFTTRLALVFARLWLWIFNVFQFKFVTSFMIQFVTALQGYGSGSLACPYSSQWFEMWIAENECQEVWSRRFKSAT